VEGSKIEVVRALMQWVETKEKEEMRTTLTMAKNGDGKTAWELAAAANNKAVCQVLKDLGDTNGASAACCIS
jgi:hypothetical protein